MADGRCSQAASCSVKMRVNEHGSSHAVCVFVAAVTAAGRNYLLRQEKASACEAAVYGEDRHKVVKICEK